MSAAGDGFPWQRLMHVGLGILKLSPREFWDATPREIAGAFAAAPAALGRGTFDDLIKRYPD